MQLEFPNKNTSEGSFVARKNFLQINLKKINLAPIFFTFLFGEQSE
jgi:hypothetical protein